MKKEGVFIVDPSPDKKFSSFTRNFGEFSSELEKSEDFQRNPPEIPDLLYDLARLTGRASQITGQLIFTVKPPPDGKYQVVLGSLPTISFVGRLLVFFFVGTFYLQYTEGVTKRFGIEDIGNSTLGVTEFILTLTIFVSDFIGSFIFWKERDDILSFLNRLTENIIEMAEDVKDSIPIQEWFPTMKKQNSRLGIVVGVSTGVSTLILINRDVYNLVLCMQGKSDIHWGYFECIFPVFATCWFTVLFSRLHFRLWLVSVIDLLQLGFKMVKEHVHLLQRQNEGLSRQANNLHLVKLAYEIQDASDKTTGADNQFRLTGDSSAVDYKEQKLNKILEKYRALENTLEEFNDLFAPHLLIGIVSIVIVVLMALFHFFVEANYKFNSTTIIFAIEAVVYALMLFCMGTAATDMASEADTCITSLRDVPLGYINPGLKQKIMLHFQHAMAVPLVVSPGYFFSLNRKMLTSVAGTLTTYLIVLIQFQTNETPGASNKGNVSLTVEE